MRYVIAHKTRFHYADSAAVCHNLVHLAPRTYERQVCAEHRLRITPTPHEIGRRCDYFGNRVNYFSIHEPHRQLTVTANSTVTLRPAAPPADDGPAWNSIVKQLQTERSAPSLEALQFVYESPYVRWSEEVREFAKASFPPDRPIYEAARELTTRIHQSFAYNTETTSVDSTVEEAFSHRSGVCQDFAHVQIACLRSLGLAARYVSGYLRTAPPPGQPRLVGADASHAWLSLYGGRLGWLDFDPTNDVQPSLDHITVAWGRDYGDVCPIQGVFVGGGGHTMHVSVDVAPQDD